MKRDRYRPRYRRIVCYPLGEHYHCADQGFSHDCEHRQKSCDPFRFALFHASPDQNGKSHNQDQSNTTRHPVAELDGSRPLKLGDNLSLTCRP